MEPEDDPSRSVCAASVSDGLKTCADCRTTKTPLWRGGPSGPKSLCNACGIRYWKKRRAAMGLKERKKEKMGEGKGDSSRKQLSSMKMGMMDFGREIIWKHQKYRRLGEEEEAAVLLMAISSGFVYA